MALTDNQVIREMFCHGPCNDAPYLESDGELVCSACGYVFPKELKSKTARFARKAIPIFQKEVEATEWP